MDTGRVLCAVCFMCTRVCACVCVLCRSSMLNQIKRRGQPGRQDARPQKSANFKAADGAPEFKLIKTFLLF